MINFEQYLVEAGGSKPGKLELVRTDTDTAYAYAAKQFKKHGRDIDEELPNFRVNYERVQMAAAQGHTQRKDMPVLDEKDIKVLQAKLKKGAIDIEDPLSVKSELDQFPH